VPQMNILTCVPTAVQEDHTAQKYMGPLPVVSGVRVTQLLVCAFFLCFVNHYLSFVSHSLERLNGLRHVE